MKVKYWFTNETGSDLNFSLDNFDVNGDESPADITVSHSFHKPDFLYPEDYTCLTVSFELGSDPSYTSLKSVRSSIWVSRFLLALIWMRRMI